MGVIKRITLGLLLSILVSGMVQAQSGVVEAFSKSYMFEKEGKNKEALAALKEVYNENSYEINMRLGWLAYLSGQFTESIAYYNNAISKYPLSVEARLGFVLPLSAISKWDQIISQYDKILSVDPNNTLVNYRLGVIYYEKKQYDKAESYLKKVINLFPFDHDSLLMLAWVKYQQGDYNQARLLFNKTLMAKPDDASAQEGLELVK